MDLREFSARLVARPLEGLGDHIELRFGSGAHEVVAVEQAVGETGDDLGVGLSEGLVDEENVRDDEQVAVGGENLSLARSALEHLLDLRAPHDRSGDGRTPRLHGGGEGVAGLEGRIRVDQIDPLGVGAFAGGEGFGLDPGLLGEVANEEIGFSELGGHDHTALELVDAFDVSGDDDGVGAAGETDLRGDDGLQALRVDGEHVDRGGGAADTAGVEGIPALFFAQGEADFETVFFEKVGVLGRLKPAVGGDEAGVTRVLAELEVEGVVLHRVQGGRGQRGHLGLGLDAAGEFVERGCAGAGRGRGRGDGGGSGGAGGVVGFEAAPPFPDAETDQAEEDDDEEELFHG